MTRKLFLLFCFLCLTSSVVAQTLWVHQGQTTIVHHVDEEAVIFNNDTFTIDGYTYSTAAIDSICTSSETVADNSVNITYAATTARVVVAANVAPYLTIQVNGAHVSIVQSSDLANEVTYTLQGASSNGSFWMDGSLKATLALNNLNLTCADSAAINIRDGKRINVVLNEGTTNVLADGAGGTQKACFMVKGHTELKGSGSLTLTGNTGHAFWGGEYVQLKKTTGAITVLSAVKDAFNVNQYFDMKGGTVLVKSAGDDGIQVSVTDDATDEQNGQFMLSGGVLNIDVSGTAAKGIKCADSLFVSGGELNITTTGGGTYDTEDFDVTAAAAIKVGGAATFSGGTLTLKSTGRGGKGINCKGDVIVNGGTFNITTTGNQYSYSRLSSSPKGIRAAGNLYINGGELQVTCSGGEGAEGIESKKEIHITEGTIVVNTYDDALNATNKIDISGGRIYAYASNNDGIDSNGTLYISGGLIISTGSSQPEEGFDCDQNTFSITGGTLIGLGGSSSTPTSSVTTQPVSLLSGMSLTQGKQLTLQTSDGTLIWSFLIPRTLNQATILVSSPQLSVGSSYTLTTGGTASGGSSWQGYTTDATVSGGSTLSSFTQSSMVNGSGSSMGGGGGPGGGGGGPGGGGGRPW